MSTDVAQKLLDEVTLENLEKDPSITFKKFEYSAKYGFVSGYNHDIIAPQHKQLQKESLTNPEIMLDNYFAILMQTQSLWTYANLYPRCFFVSPIFFRSDFGSHHTRVREEMFIRDKDRIIFAKQDPSSKLYYLCVADIYPQSLTQGGQLNTYIRCFIAPEMRLDETEIQSSFTRIIAHFFRCPIAIQCVDYSNPVIIEKIVTERDYEIERYHFQLASLAQFFCINHYSVHPDKSDLLPGDTNVENCKKILVMGMTVFVEPKLWYLQKDTTPNTAQITPERLAYAVSESMKSLTQSTPHIETPLIENDDDDDIDSTFSAEIEQLIKSV